MSVPKEEPEAVNVSSSLEKTSTILSETPTQVYGSCPQIDFSHFNDSNSDDTRFEIQNGELISNQPSPVKDKLILNGDTHHETPVRTDEYVRQDCVLFEQKTVNGRNLPPEKANSMNHTDATSFVDYFLAHDDLLQALDDYSRSVGQTSIFFAEAAGAPPSNPGKWGSLESSCSPSAALQTANTVQVNGVSVTNEMCKTEVRNNGLSKDANGEERTRHMRQRKGRDPSDSKQPSSAIMPRRSEKRKPRTYSQAVPSQHCHICSRRPTETSPHAVCGNLMKGRCRKTICTKCFHQFRWDLKAAREAPPGTWECPHCRGECPQRAQCVIYNRTSDRRRMKLINHRKRKDQAKTPPSQKASGKIESRADSPGSGTTSTKPFESEKPPANSHTVARGTNLSRTRKTSLRPSGITKPVRPSALSYAQHAYMPEGTADNEEVQETMSHQFGRGNVRSERKGSGMITNEEMAPIQAPKFVRFNQHPQLDLKGEAHPLGERRVQADEGHPAEEVTGIFDSMDFAGDVLNVTSRDDDVGLNMVSGSGNVVLDMNLGLTDIGESLDEKRGDLEGEQANLGLWDDEEVKFGELRVEEFGFAENENGLDTMDTMVYHKD